MLSFNCYINLCDLYQFQNMQLVKVKFDHKFLLHQLLSNKISRTMFRLNINNIRWQIFLIFNFLPFLFKSYTVLQKGFSAAKRSNIWNSRHKFCKIVTGWRKWRQQRPHGLGQVVQLRVRALRHPTEGDCRRGRQCSRTGFDRLHILYRMFIFRNSGCGIRVSGWIA